MTIDFHWLKSPAARKSYNRRCQAILKRIGLPEHFIGDDLETITEQAGLAERAFEEAADFEAALRAWGLNTLLAFIRDRTTAGEEAAFRTKARGDGFSEREIEDMVSGGREGIAERKLRGFTPEDEEAWRTFINGPIHGSHDERREQVRRWTPPSQRSEATERKAES